MIRKSLIFILLLSVAACAPPTHSHAPPRPEGKPADGTPAAAPSQPAAGSTQQPAVSEEKGQDATPPRRVGPHRPVLPREAPTPDASGDYVRISAIDGKFDPTHAREIFVHPSDVINLAADRFLGAQGLQAAGLPAESFVWNSTMSEDTCDMGRNEDCLAHSHFQASNHGVLYYVPEDMPARVDLKVRLAGHDSLTDSLVLRNMDYDGRHTPPPLLLNPADYAGQRLDPNIALAHMGHWITLAGVRYFAPHTYLTAAEAEWLPYQHGYWAWVPATGWTWVSYDPWGFVTDHYGFWRHHPSFGWIWQPFADLHYEPHCVTWINDGDSIGWFPFLRNRPELYIRAGFDDGFWTGLPLVAEYGRPGFVYRPGFVVVHRQDVTNVNIVNVVINGPIAFHPVVVPAELRSREFLERGALHPAPETIVENIRTKGGAQIMLPKGVHPVPSESANFLLEIKGQQIIPLGSVVQARGGVFKLVAPAAGHRAVVPDPLTHNHGGPTPAAYNPSRQAPSARIPAIGSVGGQPKTPAATTAPKRVTARTETPQSKGSARDKKAAAKKKGAKAAPETIK